MSASERDVIKKHYAYLSSKMDPSSLAPALLAENLLTDNEYEKVRAQSLNSEANQLILAGLMRKEAGYLERFIDVLQKDAANRHIVERLRAT